MKRGLAALAAVLAALCVLLVINEIFLLDPLMTPKLSTPTTFAGSWHQGSSHIDIAADGSISGHIEQLRLRNAYLKPNRTWVGRQLHWRTDYRIAGQLDDGRPVSAPLRSEGINVLDGAIFVGPNFKAKSPMKLHLVRNGTTRNCLGTNS
jgi:hypothetical protein